MSNTHNYKNPSEAQDLSHLEAGSDDEGYGFAGAKTIIDEHGWRQRAPISDRECIRICLHNSIGLCGLDKEQVKRLYRKYGGKATL
tara:strand:- start:80 stop:337 length:258 start_codon:yes stop_codon:yes gene_type:complete